MDFLSAVLKLVVDERGNMAAHHSPRRPESAVVLALENWKNKTIRVSSTYFNNSKLKSVLRVRIHPDPN